MSFSAKIKAVKRHETDVAARSVQLATFDRDHAAGLGKKARKNFQQARLAAALVEDRNKLAAACREGDVAKRLDFGPIPGTV